VDVRRQLAAVSRQLDRLPRIEALIAGLDPAIDFDLSVEGAVDPAQDAPHPHRSAAELSKSLTMIDARYAPECVTRCELAFHCRAEARAAGSADALGRSVRDALGGIESLDEALALAGGGRVAGGSGAAAHSGAAADSEYVAGRTSGPRRSGGDEAARLLRAAARAYDEAVEMLPRVSQSTDAEAPLRAAEVVVPSPSRGSETVASQPPTSTSEAVASSSSASHAPEAAS
jgi:hypothetical protein